MSVTARSGAQGARTLESVAAVEEQKHGPELMRLRTVALAAVVPVAVFLILAGVTALLAGLGHECFAEGGDPAEYCTGSLGPFNGWLLDHSAIVVGIATALVWTAWLVASAWRDAERRSP